MGSGASVSGIPKDVHFVIVGAGYGGVDFARGLRDCGAQFTIINERDSFHNVVAGVRAVVVKGFAKKTLIPLKEVFGNNFKEGRVVAIDKDQKIVRLESGEEISYGVLVISTGSTGRFPGRLSTEDTKTANDMYEALAAKIEGMNRVLVVGGGATGTEIACEIATKYPKKEVTLISARQKLVAEGSNDKFQKKLTTVLKQLKVKVIRGEKVVGLQDIPDDANGPHSITTDKGTQMEVDMVLNCTGIWINNSAYKDSLGESMDEKGQLKVNQYFQVESQKDIYAIGDCTNFEEKLAFAATRQGQLLCANLKNYYNYKPMKPWNAEKVIPIVVVVSLGPTSGAGQLRSGTLLPEFFIKMQKSKDMTISRTWKENGLSVPK